MSVTDKQWMAAIRESLATEQTTAALEPVNPVELTDDQVFQIVQALLAGGATQTALADLFQRFGGDADRLAEIETLIVLFQADDADDSVPMIEPISPPRYQLTFIKPPASTPIPEQVAALWQQGRRWVQDHVGVLWVDFAAQILGQSSLQPALVTRGGQERGESAKPTGAGEIIHQFSIGSEELGDLDLEIKAVRTDDLAYCTLIVTARIPSRWPDLSGIEVVILRSEPARSGQTDDEGQVVFELFPIKDLTQIGFKINPSSV